MATIFNIIGVLHFEDHGTTGMFFLKFPALIGAVAQNKFFENMYAEGEAAIDRWFMDHPEVESFTPTPVPPLKSGEMYVTFQYIRKDRPAEVTIFLDPEILETIHQIADSSGSNRNKTIEYLIRKGLNSG